LYLKKEKPQKVQMWWKQASTRDQKLAGLLLDRLVRYRLDIWQLGGPDEGVASELLWLTLTYFCEYTHLKESL